MIGDSLFSPVEPLSVSHPFVYRTTIANTPLSVKIREKSESELYGETELMFDELTVKNMDSKGRSDIRFENGRKSFPPFYKSWQVTLGFFNDPNFKKVQNSPIIEPQYGVITITSDTPGVRVFDWKRELGVIGRSKVLTLKLQAGNHQLSFKKDYFRTLSTSIEIQPDEVRKFSLRYHDKNEMSVLTATTFDASQLEADVSFITTQTGLFIDIPDLKISKEPLPTIFYQMPAGKYNYTIRNGDRVIQADVLEVSGNKPVKIEIL